MHLVSKENPPRSPFVRGKLKPPLQKGGRGDSFRWIVALATGESPLRKLSITHKLKREKREGRIAVTRKQERWLLNG